MKYTIKHNLVTGSYVPYWGHLIIGEDGVTGCSYVTWTSYGEARRLIELHKMLALTGTEYIIEIPT